MIHKSAQSDQEFLQPGVPDAEELEQINAQAYGTLRAEEVYTFSVVLCDNEVDRDLERFSIPALEKLAELFVGRSGIFDHTMRGRDQVARIYRCSVEQEPGRITRCGEPYTVLRAKAYMLRGSELAREIEAGIKREVSVGCSVRQTVCSICGADLREASCAHQKGLEYGGTLCCTVLDDPADAYEWSFVAVPAQPGAGVHKSFDPTEEDKVEDIMKRIRSAGDGLTLDAGQTHELAARIKKLEALAREGEAYRRSLCAEIASLCTAVPSLDPERLDGALEKMTAGELGELRKVFAHRADRDTPPAPQLARGAEQRGGADNSAFRM